MPSLLRPFASGLTGCGTSGPCSCSDLLFSDSFARSDGLVGNGWRDWQPIALSNYDVAAVSDDSLTAVDPWTNGIIAVDRQLGLTDGVEIEIKWDTSTVIGLAKQAGPLAFGAPDAAVGEMGLVLVWDTSIGVWTLMIPFKDAADYLDATNYTGLDSNVSTFGTFTPVNTLPGDGIVKIRIVGGMIEGLADGVRVLGPVPVPASMLGRDRWGVYELDPWPGFSPGTNSNGFGNIEYVTMRAYSTPLGAHPPAPSIAAVGPVRKNTGASIYLEYPDIDEGQWAWAFVARDNAGNFVTPTGDGWRLVLTTGVPGASGHAVFRRKANGTEGGTFQQFARTVHGDLGGFILALDGANPTEREGFAEGASGSGQANASSTNVTSPVLIVNGRKRGVFWVGGIAQNEAITKPAAFDLVATLGITGPTVNMTVGYAEFSPDTFTFGDNEGAFVGTLGVSRANHCSVSQALPDPR